MFIRKLKAIIKKIKFLIIFKKKLQFLFHYTSLQLSTQTDSIPGDQKISLHTKLYYVIQHISL